jgi:hypothetical protein
MTVWVLTRIWKILLSIGTHSSNPLIAGLHGVFDLRLFAISITGLIWWAIGKTRNTRQVALWLAGLLIAGIALLPSAFRQSRILNSAVQVQEFADWSRVIPSTSTVLVTPARDVGAFVWFTLMRPNYLSLDQSAGVIFSRATALEVERRSQVLLPIMEPDWKILSRNRAIRRGKPYPEPKALTTDALGRVCADPLLGFVISPERVGFDPISHEHDGIWKGWNLYDCRKVRQGAAPT